MSTPMFDDTATSRMDSFVWVEYARTYHQNEYFYQKVSVQAEDSINSQIAISLLHVCYLDPSNKVCCTHQQHRMCLVHSIGA